MLQLADQIAYQLDILFKIVLVLAALGGLGVAYLISRYVP